MGAKERVEQANGRSTGEGGITEIELIVRRTGEFGGVLVGRRLRTVFGEVC